MFGSVDSFLMKKPKSIRTAKKTDANGRIEFSNSLKLGYIGEGPTNNAPNNKTNKTYFEQNKK